MIAVDTTEVIADLLGRGHAVRFRASGDSMEPLIRPEDALHVEPLAGHPPRRGEVVLVLAERGLTAHRVVRRSGTTIVTRGDNAPADDPAVPLSRVVGRVTAIERAGKRRRVSRLAPALLPLARLAERLRRRLGGTAAGA